MIIVRMERFKSAGLKRYGLLSILLFGLIFIFNFRYIEAKIALQLPQASEALLFSDTFDRPDSSSIGNGWTEVEAAGAQVGIQSNQLCFLDTSDVANRPIAQAAFQQVNSGELLWNFHFDWIRDAQEGTYRVFMQLGDQAQIGDDNQNAGIAVNLVWTRLNDVHQMLGYRYAGVDTALDAVSGPTNFSILVNLDSQTYQVSLDGGIIQSGIPFDNPVDINTIRFFSDVLNDIYFSGRCIDNVSINSLGTITPTATMAPTDYTGTNSNPDNHSNGCSAPQSYTNCNPNTNTDRDRLVIRNTYSHSESNLYLNANIVSDSNKYSYSNPRHFGQSNPGDRIDWTQLNWHGFSKSVLDRS